MGEQVIITDGVIPSLYLAIYSRLQQLYIVCGELDPLLVAHVKEEDLAHQTRSSLASAMSA